MAVLVEDAVQAVMVTVVRTLRRRRPVIVPFVGHGTTSRARIGARVVLGHPKVAEAAAPQAVPGLTEQKRRAHREVLGASLSRFLTIELARVPVTIEPPDGPATTVMSDREGYVDSEVDLPGLEPGWHDVRLSLAGDRAAETAKVLVVDPDATVGVVSDVDDTILETGLTRGLAFLKATLLTDVDKRTPLPGAAALYRALAAPPDGCWRPVFYVSTSPWNLHEMLLQFISLRGFPLGPLLLTDWGPGQAGLFRIGAREHKLTLIRRLIDEHPRLDLVLVGDSGQLDPEIYAAVAQEHPSRIRSVYIRRTASTSRDRDAQLDVLAARVSAVGVPMLAVDDSVQIAEHAASIGLLHPAALDEVRAEMVATSS